MELWDRYKRGESKVFTRRLYTLQGQQTFDEIRRKYARDARVQADRRPLRGGVRAASRGSLPRRPGLDADEDLPDVGNRQGLHHAGPCERPASTEPGGLEHDPLGLKQRLKAATRSLRPCWGGPTRPERPSGVGGAAWHGGGATRHCRWRLAHARTSELDLPPATPDPPGLEGRGKGVASPGPARFSSRRVFSLVRVRSLPAGEADCRSPTVRCRASRPRGHDPAPGPRSRHLPRLSAREPGKCAH